MPNKENKGHTTKEECARCGWAIDDLNYHYYKIPPSTSATDVHMKYKDACRYN